MGRKKLNNAYQYFELFDDRLASRCKVCHKVLKTQHGTNLLNHLRNNHDEDYQKVKVLNELTYPKKDSKETDGPRSLSTSSTLPDPQMAEEQEESILAGKKKSNHVQKYFKTSGPDNVCNICDKTIKGHHASNLMGHLKQHPEQFSQLEKLNQQQMPHSWTRVDIKESPSSDEEDTETINSSENPHFLMLEDSRVVCVVCQDAMDPDSDKLKEHLLRNHPELLGSSEQNQDNSNVKNSTADTEVIYVAEDHLQLKTQHEEHKPSTSTHKRTTKRQRSKSSDSSDDEPLKKRKNDSELKSFLGYIKCLLKKLPEEAFSKVQIDIINIILNANKQFNNK